MARADDRGPSGGEPVAIVGMAALFPGAGDLDTYWRNIVGGVDAIREVPPGRWDDEYYHPEAAAAAPPGAREPAAERIYARRGGFVDDLATFDPTEFGIMPLAVEWTEPDQLLALRLAAEAVSDAGGTDNLGDRSRVGVVLGRGGYLNAGMARLEQRVRTARQLAVTLAEVLPDLPAEAIERVHDAFVAKLGPERPEAVIGLVPNLAASRIANRLDLHGPAYTVDAACASSLIAVDAGVRELRARRADAMVVGGTHLVHEPTFWSTFALLRALSPSQRIRPFDRAADGVLIGEGIGLMVLKRLADAQRDGDRIYAVLRGTGMSSDGRASTLLAPAPAGQALAVRRAWQDAGLDPRAPDAVGLIEAHGTATPAGDAAELATMAEVFGPGTGEAPDIGIGSVKSMIGHAMPAAGAAGLIKAALALYHRTLPPTLHCDDPHPGFAGTRFTPLRAAAPWPEPANGPRRAGVNAFGFGGINAHAVVEEPPSARAPSPARTFPAPAAAASAPRPAAGSAAAAGAAAASAAPDGGQARAEPVLLLAAATPAELAEQLDRPDEELLARDDAADPPAGGPCRLAIVAPNARRLALARTVVARGTPWRGRNDLWFTPRPLLMADAGRAAGGDGQAGKLAFLFCGLEDRFDPKIDDVCEHFGLPRPDLGDLSELGGHGLASVQVNRVLDEALRRLGIAPDLIAGHSIGEWNALISAGAWPNDYVDSFIGRFDPSSVVAPGVCFGALGCGVDTAAPVIADLPEIVISHDNCPHQSIICGQRSSVETALERLRGRGVIGQLLPFQSGFHTPFIEPYLAPLRAGLDVTPVLPPSVPVWSATTVAPYPTDPAGNRELSLRHLREPVRFRELIERLHDVGTRVFVQVGVGSIAGFVEDTLGRSGDRAGAERAPFATVVTNTPKRSGIDQLRRAAVALWAEGASPRLDLLPCRGRPAPRTAATPEAAAQPADAAQHADAGRAATRAGTRRRGGQPMLLRLGAPFIRLGPDAPNLLAEASASRAAASAVTPAPTEAAAASPEPAATPTPQPPPNAVPAAPVGAEPAPPGVPAWVPTPAGAGGAPAWPAAHPVLAEFDAALAETAAVLADVRRQWAHTRDPAGATARQAGPGARARAATGTPVAPPQRAAPPATPAEPPAPRVPTATPAAPAHRPPPASPTPSSPPPRPDPAVPPAVSTAHGAPAVPPTGTPEPGVSVGSVGPISRTIRRTLSLADHPYVIDHCFYRQPPGWADLSDRFPVVPMTTVLQMMIDDARAVAPGRTVVAVRDVRALRWVAIEPPIEVTVTCTELPDGAVRVSMDGYARATVVFGDPPPAPQRTAASADLPADGRLPGERPSPHQADELYGGRWMFHGPGYQGITHVDGIAPLGARGQLVVSPAPGALLDALGQLYGYWASQCLDSDSVLLPQSVSQIRFFGPDPVVGDRMRCVVRVRDIAEKTVTADLELRRADGTVWAEVTGWTDRRFTSNPWLWQVTRMPELHTVAQPRPDGWLVVPDYWRDMASRELIVRHFLDAERRRELASKTPKAAREWLLGRIAAADGVRRWLWARGAGPIWGIEVVIGNDPSGRPVVTRLPSRPGIPAVAPPQVSIAHKVDLAVALVDDEGPVGIDLETVAERGDGVIAAGLTPAERALLDRLVPAAGQAGGEGATARAAWFARLWAAKEAAAKADGTGLEGRPRRFEVDQVLPPTPAAATPGADGEVAPPVLLRVSVRVRDAAAAERAGTGDVSHRRWVAVRTVDQMGELRPEPRVSAQTGGGPNHAGAPDPARLGDHVVAWTSPAVEHAAAARLRPAATGGPP